MVDKGYDRLPALQRDPFWDEEIELLYSEESAKLPSLPLKGSLSEVRSYSRGQLYDEEQAQKNEINGQRPISDIIEADEDKQTEKKSS
ncbi:unnamed protein product, partial [Strongylus vulgaris]